jgi:uncharacterized membrane protein
MIGINQILLQILMILLFFTFVSVALSTTGTVLENALLVKFWVLALYGFMMIMVTLALMCLIYLMNLGISNYQQQSETRPERDDVQRRSMSG